MKTKIFKKKRFPLKTTYYFMFIFFIVIPILIVLISALLILNQQFKNQAIENIKMAQETIIAELQSDIDILSMRLSHFIYTNNNEVLDYAAGTDTHDINTRYYYEQKLTNAGNLALEPVKDIISVEFYMKSGNETYIKNQINRTQTETKSESWYQTALKNPNSVFIGSYDTKSLNDLFHGGKEDLLVLVFALAPDIKTDRSQKIEMVTFYQSTRIADRIKEYNRRYLSGKNKLGITQIKSESGEMIFSTTNEEDFSDNDYTLVKSSVKLNGAVWYVESHIKTSHLTSDFFSRAIMIFAAAVLILMLAGYYSRFFLRDIIKPIESMSAGLKSIEEGNLEIHVSPSGQFEIRSMIHQFNAMARRLKILFIQYEEQIKSMKKSPKDYFAKLIKGELSFDEALEKIDFLKEQYVLMGFHVENYNPKENEKESSLKLVSGFELNPRFSSRCLIYLENTRFFWVLYRIEEEEYISNIEKMLSELKQVAKRDFEVDISICIGEKMFGLDGFEEQILIIRDAICIKHLRGVGSITDLEKEKEFVKTILDGSKEYERLADALFIADEKNMTEEKEILFEIFHQNTFEEIYTRIFSVILAIGKKFSTEQTKFSDIFRENYNYIEKIKKIDEPMAMKLWLTNYFSWIMDYSASKLNITEADTITKAKHYIMTHYENPDLSLGDVAEYVELNEKYFTNRFSKETGETFLSYLTGLRIQRAKDLLKTTSFKVYEIAKIVGYHNVEHFNRTFKKSTGLSPMQYKKTT